MADPQKPAPDASPEEIAKYLSSAPPAQAQAWLADNGSKVDLAVLEQVFTRVNMDDRPEMAPVRSSLQDAITAGQDSGARTRQINQAAQERVAVAASGSPVSKDLDGDGKVQPDEQAAFDKAKQEAADNAASQTGVTADAYEQQIDAASMGDDFVVLPDILARGSGFNGQPSKAEQDQLIQAWNEFYPDQPVTNFKELADRVNQGKNNPTVQAVVDYGFGGGAEPVIEYKYDFGTRELDRGAEQRMGGGATTGLGFGSSSTIGSVTVSADQFAALQKIYGGRFGHKDLKQMAYLANQIGLKDASGNNGWQIMAAIAAGLGFFEMGDPAETAAASQAAMDKVPWEGRDPLAKPAAQSASAAKQAITAREMEMLRKRALKFKEGLTIYGQNDALAYLHAINPSLATNIANTGSGKPVNPGAAKKANQLFLNSGFDQQQLQAMGYYSLGLQDYFDYRDATAAASAPQGPVRQMPDPDAIRQNAKDLWIQLYASDPTEAQLQKVVGAVTNALLSADIDSSDGMVSDVNANAQIRKAVEGDPQYRELYGNKPGGLSEAEYQGQFKAGAASILGNQAADPSVIRSGMRTGSYQTSVGAAAASSQAQDNSTWLGRLAQAGQIVSANT